MNQESYDVVVIGTGPGGEGAAMQAAKLGKTVATIDKHETIGGGCTHWGTIPSKSLRYSIFQMTNIAKSKLFRDAGISPVLSFPELRRSAASVIEKQVNMRMSFYERNGVPVFSRDRSVRQ